MRIGLALGGGGARGLAHLRVLQEMEDLGLRPDVISGTSMGAIVGAMYASGLSAREIRSGVEQHIISSGDAVRDVLGKSTHLLKWLKFVHLDLGRGGLMRADGFIGYMLEQIRVRTFEELRTHLLVVATDFGTGREVVFRSGDLEPAIKASMAIPGVFSPVVVDGRVLVDGGVADNVPFDILRGWCDRVVAVDVPQERSDRGTEPPHALDAVLGMYDLLVEKVMLAKAGTSAPDVSVRIGIEGVRALDFHRIESVLEQADAHAPQIRRELSALVSQAGRQSP